VLYALDCVCNIRSGACVMYACIKNGTAMLPVSRLQGGFDAAHASDGLASGAAAEAVQELRARWVAKVTLNELALMCGYVK